MPEPNVVGNHYDKYGTRNPIARRLMAGFLRSAVELYGEVEPASVLEVGCGEGRLAQHLLAHARRPPERFEACDLSLERLAPGLSERIHFREASVEALPYADGQFELVVCCEVLEHVPHPAAALVELRRVARRAVLLSTPREPLWRALNLARGKYLRALGNTPGHVQHFSRRGLLRLVEPVLHVRRVRTPLPWTMLLADVPR